MMTHPDESDGASANRYDRLNELLAQLVRKAKELLARAIKLIKIIVMVIIVFALTVLVALLRILAWLLPKLLRLACALFALWSMFTLAQTAYTAYLDTLPFISSVLVVVVIIMLILVPINLAAWVQYYLGERGIKLLPWATFVFGGLVAWAVIGVTTHVDSGTRLVLPNLFMGIYSPLLYTRRKQDGRQSANSR